MDESTDFICETAFKLSRSGDIEDEIGSNLSFLINSVVSLTSCSEYDGDGIAVARGSIVKMMSLTEVGNL